VRILHAITTLDVGGAEMHLLAQVRGQCARGHSVRVVYFKGQGTLAPDFLAAGAERVERSSFAGGLFGDLRTNLVWAQVTHTHLLKADMGVAVLATLAGRRAGLVSSKHNDEQVLTRPLVSLVHGLIGRLPRRTIPLSDHVARFIERHGRIPLARMTRIYYGLDPTPFEEAALAAPDVRAKLRRSLGLGDDEVVFTCVARFAPQKAHAVLLRAFARARASGGGERLRLLLVGDDPFGEGRARAVALAHELGVHGPVVFAGIRRDVPQVLAASDAFVMCSLWEGLGLVFLEAMATGLPVLATRVSAVPEVVEDGRTGLLVPPADVDALCAAMLRLADDAELRRALGSAGRERVRKNFALERMIEETLDVYSRLHPQPPRGR